MQGKGCLLYAYGKDVLDLGLIRIVERWECREAIAAHAKAPHIKAWADAREAAGGTLERDILTHEVTGKADDLTVIRRTAFADLPDRRRPDEAGARPTGPSAVSIA